MAASYSALVILFSSSIRHRQRFDVLQHVSVNTGGFIVEGALGKPAMIAISESVNSSKFYQSRFVQQLQRHKNDTLRRILFK